MTACRSERTRLYLPSLRRSLTRASGSFFGMILQRRSKISLSSSFQDARLTRALALRSTKRARVVAAEMKVFRSRCMKRITRKNRWLGTLGSAVGCPSGMHAWSALREIPLFELTIFWNAAVILAEY
eukprot:Amastigsp_a843819_42.p4 type:complete len:127 gc:universal Amastigsp_a843819_42:1000-1380(+)